MRRARRLLVGPILVLLACDGPAARDAPQGDADAPPETSIAPASERLDARALVAALGRMPAFAAQLASARRAASGVREHAIPVGDVLEVTLPRSARGVTHLALRGAPGIYLDVRATALADVDAERVDGAIVFRDAAPGTDVVHASGEGAVEELRVLRSVTGRVEARWRLDEGPEVSTVRATDDGRVEVLDRHGRVRIAAAPMFAVDARGVRRELRVRYDDHALVATLDAEGLAPPIVLDPKWSATSGGLVTARSSATATRLANGKVLIAGGAAGSTLLSSAELYDRGAGAAGGFASTGAMPRPHADHAAALLTDGRVLVVGGSTTGGVATNAAEIFDPATGAWSSAGTVGTTVVVDFSLARLPGGSALVVGGQRIGGDTVGDAFTFDPSTKTWAPTAGVAGIQGHAAIALPSGKVFIVGGETNYAGENNGATLAQLYDPVAKTWSLAGDMAHAGRPQATLLANGKVFVANDGVVQTWDGAGGAGAWATVGSSVLVWNPPLELLGGRVFFPPFGDGVPRIFDWVTKTTANGPATAQVRNGAVASLLTTGEVLLVGGVVGGSAVSTAELFSIGDRGAACAASADCTGGLCVDGVCCATTCPGQCQACDVPGSLGTCADVDGAAPHGARAACAAPYLTCKAGACATSCSSDADCVSGSWCAGGACVPKKGNGASCGAAGQCGSGFCVDGVCCGSACAGQCEACDVGTSAGTCAPVTTGQPHGARAACVGAGPCQAQCGPASRTACAAPPDPSTVCAAATCAAGAQTPTRFCNGSGACLSAASSSCGVYGCGASACKTSCVTAADCATGYFCEAGACKTTGALGAGCVGDGACASGHCVDGACCAVAACAAPDRCDANRLGTCATPLGEACTSASACGSGFCVDGVCCERACDGQCEACDVGGARGACTAVKGAPHGARVACSDGGAEPCAAAACDGVERLKCDAIAAGPAVSCAAPSCAAGVATEASFCDGAGHCKPGSTKSCAPFACGDDACRTFCASSADCAKGNVCDAGQCVAARARCTTDGAGTIPIDATTELSCAPYRCDASTGDCYAGCTTTDQCAQGTLCDGARCVPPAPATDGGEGGCSATGAHGTGGGTGLAALVLAAITRSRRARRAVEPRRRPGGTRSR